MLCIRIWISLPSTRASRVPQISSGDLMTAIFHAHAGRACALLRSQATSKCKVPALPRTRADYVQNATSPCTTSALARQRFFSASPRGEMQTLRHAIWFPEFLRYRAVCFKSRRDWNISTFRKLKQHRMSCIAQWDWILQIHSTSEISSVIRITMQPGMSRNCARENVSQ